MILEMTSVNHKKLTTKRQEQAKPAAPAKPQKERVQKPKEEKVAERRQRRNNRKKVRVNAADKNANSVENNAVENKAPKNAAAQAPIVENNIVETSTLPTSVDNNNVVDNAAAEPTSNKAKDEQRPRSRRSPRHMRAHGQRRRQNADAAQSNSNEITEDPVTTRYPEQSTDVSESVNKEVSTSSEVTESAPTVAEVQKVQSDALTEVVNNPANEIQQDLPFDEPQAPKVKVEKHVAATVETEVAAEPIAKVKAKPTVEDVNVAAVQLEEVKLKVGDAEAVVVIETEVEASTEQTAIVDEKPTEVEEKPKKVRAKAKNIQRKVKAAASKPAGKASAPMTKPETIVSNGVIPREFVASEQRAAHATSGKSASSSHATSRHSAAATNPTLG